jgi:hypothetical protein
VRARAIEFAALAALTCSEARAQRADTPANISYGLALYAGTRRAAGDDLDRALVGEGYSTLDSTYRTAGIEGRVGTGSLRIPFLLELELGSRDAERDGDRIEFSERSVAFGAAWEFRVEERFAVVPGVLLSTLELEVDPGDSRHQLFGNSGGRSRKQLGALEFAASFETDVLVDEVRAVRSGFLFLRLGYRRELFEHDWRSDGGAGGLAAVDVSGPFVHMGLGYGQRTTRR